MFFPCALRKISDRNRKVLGRRDQFKKKLKVGEQTQLISWSGHGSLPSEVKPNFLSGNHRTENRPLGRWTLFIFPLYLSRSTTDFLSRSNLKGASIGDYWIRKAVKIWKFNIAASISCWYWLLIRQACSNFFLLFFGVSSGIIIVSSY